MSARVIRKTLLAAAMAIAIPSTCFFATAAHAEESAKAAGEKTSASVPTGVVGSWKYGSISPLWVKDLNTGMLSSSQQMGSFYEFAADGTFKHFVLISFNNTGWKNGTFTEEYGNASFDPQKGTVTLTVTSGKYRVMDNRVTKNNYTRDMTTEEQKKHSSTVIYKLTKGDDGKPRLDIGHATNEGSTSYSRWETSTTKPDAK